MVKWWRSDGKWIDVLFELSSSNSSDISEQETFVTKNFFQKKVFQNFLVFKKLQKKFEKLQQQKKNKPSTFFFTILFFTNKTFSLKLIKKK